MVGCTATSNYSGFISLNIIIITIFLMIKFFIIFNVILFENPSPNEQLLVQRFLEQEQKEEENLTNN
ncbi:hypothetical protein HZS_7331 [Henneguya salminicola]|nr:hypothetical protein HZS_7331 [Henneguya salminicola]